MKKETEPLLVLFTPKDREILRDRKMEFRKSESRLTRIAVRHVLRDPKLVAELLKQEQEMK